MRATLPVTLLLSALLTACASSSVTPPSKQVSQTSILKVHPGLLGKQVPSETPEPRATAPAIVSTAAVVTPVTTPVAEPVAAPAATPAVAPIAAPAAEPAATPVTAANTNSSSEPPATVLPAELPQQSDIYFDAKSAKVRSEFEPTLQAHARYLAANPSARIRIDGNADEPGSTEYNAKLGLQRAANVRQAMIAYGAPENQISARTLGSFHPKERGRDEVSRRVNRRAEVIYEQEN